MFVIECVGWAVLGVPLLGCVVMLRRNDRYPSNKRLCCSLPSDAPTITMATPRGVTVGFRTTFALAAAIVGFLMMAVLVMVSMLTVYQGRGKPSGPNNVRKEHTTPVRANPYSGSSSCSNVAPSMANVDPVIKSPHTPPPLSSPQHKNAIPSGVNSHHPVKPNHSPLPVGVCPPTSAPQPAGVCPPTSAPQPAGVCPPTSAPQPAGVYDVLMHHTKHDTMDGRGLVGSHSDRRESTSLTSSLFNKSCGSANTGSSCPSRSSSHSSSHRRPSHDIVYCERLEPSMLHQRAGPQDTPTQALPFASMYGLPKPLSRDEQPITITKDNIIELSDLGVGQFGQVVLAGTKGLSPKDLRLGHSTDRTRSLLVAIKKLRTDADQDLKKTFKCEIKFMSRLKHNNVVRLLGVSDGVEPFIVMEYMENGDLHSFLRKHKVVSDTADHLNEYEVTPLILMYVAVQIANGMRYLASRRFVHRDLATRNCLVGRDFVVKVSDFGMSCSLYQSLYYLVQGRLILPIRWMAFESFYGKFSVKSDAWSYGVTMWEIFTLAQAEPYSDMTDEEVIADAIKGAGRTLLAPPPTCTKEVYDVMRRCWVHEPVIRADFEEVYSRLFLLYTQMSGHVE